MSEEMRVPAVPEKKEPTLDDILAEYLQKYCLGENNVVGSRVLESKFNISGMLLRKHINGLRCQGVPICSNGSGYYYAKTGEELRRTINQLSGRAGKLMQAVTGLSEAFQRDPAFGAEDTKEVPNGEEEEKAEA